MSEPQIPTPEQELARAGEAERVLATPIFKEACNRIDAELRTLRESVPMSDTDMHTRLILAEQLWGKLLDHLKAVMMSGEFAREQLALRERRTDRLREALKRGVRF